MMVMIKMIITIEKAEAVKKSLIMVTPPLTASNRAYIDPAMSKNIIGADVRPASIIAVLKSLSPNPFIAA